MDLPALQQALQEAQLRGDHEAMASLMRQLDLDALPTRDEGELQRTHMRGAPPDQVTIIFAPADTAPATYPADLPWLRGTKTSVLSLGPDEPVVVFWSCADAGAACEQVVQESLAQGWKEAPGLQFPTAAGVRPVFLEREGSIRHLVAVQKTDQGMVQLTQGIKRRPSHTAAAEPRAG